jgi:hypothetical protein
MSAEQQEERRHESVDHLHPTDAGMMESDPTHQPATGVMGDETLVRLNQPGMPPYPGVEGGEDRRGADPHPGPTRWQHEDDSQH